MGVKAYLLYGFDLEEIIYDLNENINRINLTVTPSVIKYSVDSCDNGFFFRNSLNSCIVLQEVGEFVNCDNAFKAYSDDNDLFKFAYNKCIEEINDRFACNIKDTDWCMVVCYENNKVDSECFIKSNIAVINNLDIYDNSNIMFRALIDMSFIYQTCNLVSRFLKSLIFIKRISKFQQFQIAYYSQELYKVNKPELFLTNTQEIEVYRRVFENWEIYTQIQDVIGSLNQSISNYSFLWDYNNSKSQYLSNSLLALFTVLVGYPALKEVVLEFFPKLEYIAAIVFLIIIIIIVIKIIYIQVIDIFDFIQYKKKRK